MATRHLKEKDDKDECGLMVFLEPKNFIFGYLNRRRTLSCTKILV